MLNGNCAVRLYEYGVVPRERNKICCVLLAVAGHSLGKNILAQFYGAMGCIDLEDPLKENILIILACVCATCPFLVLHGCLQSA